MSLPVAILAGGLATRLHPVTERIPKSLVEVAGRPFAEHQVMLLSRHGITDIVFLVGHLGGMVRDTLGDGSRWGVGLRYIFDGPHALGTGGAIRQALPELGDAFFVLYGDSYLECDYAGIERAFTAGGTSGLMTVCRNDDRWDRSNVLFDGGRIVAYDKQARTPACVTSITGSAPSGRARSPATRTTSVRPGRRLSAAARRRRPGGFDVPGRFMKSGPLPGSTKRALTFRKVGQSSDELRTTDLGETARVVPASTPTSSSAWSRCWPASQRGGASFSRRRRERRELLARRQRFPQDRRDRSA
jgi:choline kinase